MLRKIKHINELIKAQNEGFESSLVFVVQMDGINIVKPNIATHPEFAEAFDKAKKSGVKVYALPCHIEPNGIAAAEKIMCLL